MSEPLGENEALETELIDAAIEMFDEMLRMKSRLPKSIFEKHLRPRLRRALLDARILEADRCEAYGKIGSPRVMELKRARNSVNFEVAKLNAGRVGRSEPE